MNSTELARLIQAIASSDADTRSEAIAALEEVRREDLSSLDPLMSGLASDHSSIAFWCLTKLKSLGASEAANNIKSSCLHHPSVAIRQGAIDALSEWCPADTDVRQAVIEYIDAPELPLRWSAMRAVLAIGRWPRPDLDKIKALALNDKSWMGKMILRLDPA